MQIEQLGEQKVRKKWEEMVKTGADVRLGLNSGNGLGVSVLPTGP